MPIKNARAKGNQYELATIKKLKELGWTEACSSRSESKRLDDKGVDICYTPPLNIQCKAVERLGSYHSILDSMPDDKNFNIIFHKRNRQGTVVAMTEEDFFKLLKLAKII